MTEQTGDGLAALTEVLAIKRSGWHRVAGPDGVALFPETAKDVDAWEQRALAQNAEAEAMERANRLEAKAEVNSLAERKRIMRGD